jgi:hypothetical protein
VSVHPRLHLTRLLGVLAAISCLALSGASAANGTWKYDTEDQGHPRLANWENDKTVVMIGCGHAFAIHAVYPGAPKPDNEKATITIANGKTEMKLDGVIDGHFAEMSPPNTTHFVQFDLGFTRQDPELYGRRWKRLEARLLNFLDSGRPLTVSAEGKSYELPPIRIHGWKERFRKIC